MIIRDSQATHLIYEDVIKGENVISYKKKLGQAANIFANADGEDPEKLLYTVYSYEAGDPEKNGDLYWGLTVLEPVTVNGECNMTRGHFHSDRDCAEFYFGIDGEGLLMLMDEKGVVTAERVKKGSLHHIDGRFAHRLINTGDTQLSVGACWPTTAGHDYAATEKEPFKCRIFKENGEIVIKEEN